MRPRLQHLAGDDNPSQFKGAVIEHADPVANARIAVALGVTVILFAPLGVLQRVSQRPQHLGLRLAVEASPHVVHRLHRPRFRQRLADQVSVVPANEDRVPADLPAFLGAVGDPNELGAGDAHPVEQRDNRVRSGEGGGSNRRDGAGGGGNGGGSGGVHL